ncbi:MAG: nitroreductase family protein [Myxococcales bacterium]|nr:nitroreductase family protein [Polyangiaceae bacterium]MDW8248099.1 nitroreductase family protein [Myxococcales bacterium]
MTRKADFDIDPLFLERWSPRAMSGQPVAEADLRRLFEAARWAPSSGNSQPWRFVYARAGTSDFDRFFGLLAQGNRPWCARAGALILLAARTVNDQGKPMPSASFDTGAAWMALALQGTKMGLVVHAMGGFDAERSKVEVGLPPEVVPCCMIAVGQPGSVEDLPEPYRSREQPNDRKPQATFVSEGKYTTGS